MDDAALRAARLLEIADQTVEASHDLPSCHRCADCRDADVLRDAAGDIQTLLAELARQPYPNEYDDVLARAEHAEQANATLLADLVRAQATIQRLEAERDEIRRDLTAINGLVFQMFPLLTPDEAHPHLRVIMNMTARHIDRLENQRNDDKETDDSGAGDHRTGDRRADLPTGAILSIARKKTHDMHMWGVDESKVDYDMPLGEWWLIKHLADALDAAEQALAVAQGVPAFQELQARVMEICQIGADDAIAFMYETLRTRRQHEAAEAREVALIAALRPALDDLEAAAWRRSWRDLKAARQTVQTLTGIELKGRLKKLLASSDTGAAVGAEPRT